MMYRNVVCVFGVGFLPEFVGRFPKIIVLHGLDEGMLYDILTKKENNILLQKERIYQNFGVSFLTLLVVFM